ncbi:MAG: bifunctional folylpolyglutamate synthase/dihydrofolate synthase [Candidatus Limnocylindrales bacterium]
MHRASPGQSTTCAITYEEALRAISAPGRFAIKPGLERTRGLLAGLDHPERVVRGVLIGGTNGKGSVLALAASALRAAGYRVGEAAKPHLVDYRERLVSDGHMVDEGAFAGLIAEVLAIGERVALGTGAPTEFELLTAAVLAHFAREAVDVALIEVGLGGRLDATNVWNGGAAAITNVTLDHTDRLGTTVRAIAVEKAAIIKRGNHAVTGATGDALPAIRRRAARMGATLVETAPARLLGIDRDGIDVDLPPLGRTRVGLRGRHQAANVAVADALLDALCHAGIARVPADARRTGYATAAWPGRLELFEVDRAAGRRQVLLDGAHNPAGAAALAEALGDLGPHLEGDTAAPPSLLMAMMADKDVRATVQALEAWVDRTGARVICTEVDLARAASADMLGSRWTAANDSRRQILVEPDLRRALDRALRESGLVVVAGSLYLVGDVRRCLLAGEVGHATVCRGGS